MFGLVGFMVFNATFNNFSVISWRSSLLIEQTGEQEKKLYCMTLRINISLRESKIYQKYYLNVGRIFKGDLGHTKHLPTSVLF